MPVTASQLKAQIEVGKMIAQAIKETGDIGMPSGILYATLMSILSLDQYNQYIAMLKRIGVVEERFHVLYYKQ